MKKEEKKKKETNYFWWPPAFCNGATLAFFPEGEKRW